MFVCVLICLCVASRDCPISDLEQFCANAVSNESYDSDYSPRFRMKAIQTLPTVRYAHKDEMLSPSLFNFNKIQKYIMGFSFAYFPPVCPFSSLSLRALFSLPSLSQGCLFTQALGITSSCHTYKLDPMQDLLAALSKSVISACCWEGD